MQRPSLMRHGWLLALLAIANRADAHAPLPTRVAVTPDAGRVALDLPGFGLLYREQPGQPFRYVCDALLGILPSADPRALTFLSDGSLVMGTRDGIRVVMPGGCPLAPKASELGHAEVLALTPQGDSLYAVVGGDEAGLWRSDDGAGHWTRKAALADSAWTTAVVTRSDAPEQVYVSVGGPSPTLHASTDGGATLQLFPQEASLTLLHAEAAASGRLWASARDAQTVGNRGLAILRADGPAGPWQTMLRVNYFGGFVVDPSGVIWIGDEIGGVYRSDDGGENFSNLAADADVACLAYGGSAVWACNPGTLDAPALQTLPIAKDAFHGVVALDEIAELVDCPDLDVPTICAGAWVEWRRDVLMEPVTSADASVGDAGGPASDAAMAPADAGPEAEFTPPEPIPARPKGCALATQHSGSTRGFVVAWLLLAGNCARLARRRRGAQAW